ncbi:unnamed protein product [Mesocestoides corti]|uniref:Uncharacterized protein n=1 Tax=Mesocestoides corti TaxID=53468 RepID=A0A0R3UDE6_MESCO|nr:unnamed protein product [Mesocestoides corti]
MMGPNEATLSDHAVILSNLAQSQSAGSNRFAHFIATQVHGAPVREGSSSGSCRLRALSDRFANNESLEAVANASSPPIAPDNAAPRQEPRDVGKSAESTINVDDESGEDSDSGESFAFADCKLVFNLADYLPERGYTKVPPNQHVFKGAEVGFVYEMRSFVDRRRLQGPFVRRCAMDQDIQRHREGRRNGAVGDLEVIDCDLSSSSSPSSCGEAKIAEKPATSKASSAHQTEEEEEADTLQTTASAPP